MTDTAIVVAALTAAIELIIMAIAIFCIGFFIGFKREDDKIVQDNKTKKDISLQESEDEQKAKKEWKKFLNYDGSSDSENSF